MSRFVVRVSVAALLVLLMNHGPTRAETSKQSTIPEFKDYRVTVFKGIPVKPESQDLLEGDPRLKDWDWVEHEVQKGPNFAGHFTIVQSGCGTGCTTAFIIDSQTGRLYRGPFGTLDVQKGNGRYFSGLSFQLDSGLLIVEGCEDVDRRRSQGKAAECSRSYYSWEMPKFKLILSVPLETPEWLRGYLEIRPSGFLTLLSGTHAPLFSTQ